YDQIYDTASAVTLDSSHRVAAWNALCALVDRCSTSHNASVSRLIWKAGWWRQVFDLYLKQANLARPKSSRQLLVTLTTVLRTASEIDTHATKGDLVASLVRPLVEQGDPGVVKAAVLALAHFLSKGVLQVENLFEYQRGNSTSDQKLDEINSIDDLLYTLFVWVGRADFSSAICQLLGVILNLAAPTIHNKRCLRPSVQSIWSAPLLRAFQDGRVDGSSLRDYVLPLMCSRNASEFAHFIQSIGVQKLFDHQLAPLPRSNGLDEQSIELICAALQAGKDADLISSTSDPRVIVDSDSLVLPIRGIKRLMISRSRIVRLTGLHLLTVSSVSTRPMEPWTLAGLKRHLSHYFADTDANFRSEVFGLLRRLVDRIRAVTAAAARSTKLPSRDTDVLCSSILRSHQAFLKWLLLSLPWELRSTASYQRHISALKIIGILARSGLDNRVDTGLLSKTALGETKWAFHVPVLTNDLRRLLLDLVIDPFDDVRQNAVSILSMYPASDIATRRDIATALSRGEALMMATGRADQANGVAHMHALLYSFSPGEGTILSGMAEALERMLAIAQEDLAVAVNKQPVHGLLEGVRLIVQKHGTPILQEDYLVDRLINCLYTIWDVVKPTLCNDAPEGYLPEEMEEAAEISTKDTLSYCWRALKEASLLLGAIFGILPAETASDRERLAELCFIQLAELRHRGAFSTVAQTWTMCCLRTAACSSLSDQSMLQTWYLRVVEMLCNNTTINTRRSAGLPALLCGVLVAFASKHSVDRAFTDLEAVARESVDPARAQEGSLPQVHAINCIREVLKNSRLGEASEHCVPAATELAAFALQSEAWAVRNCGLMLFRAAIDRLLGTSDAYLEDDLAVRKRLSTEQSLRLLPVVLKLLNSEEPPMSDVMRSEQRLEGVFPALQLLPRLSVTDEQHAILLQLVRKLMASPVWHVRDKAARAFASLVPREHVVQSVRDLLQTTIASQNALHGSLLGAKYLVHSFSGGTTRSNLAREGSFTSPQCDRYECWAIINAAKTVYVDNPCSVTKAAYVDLSTECALALRLASDQHVGLPTDCSPGSQRQLSFTGADAMLRCSLARALILPLLTSLDSSRKEFTSVTEVLSETSRMDADACIAFMAQAKTFITTTAGVAQNALNTLVAVCQRLLAITDVNTRLLCDAEELLLVIASANRQTGQSWSALTDFSADHLRSLPLTSRNANQRFADLDLQLAAACLEHLACSSTSPTVEAIAAIKQWQIICERSINGLGLCTVEAVARAVNLLNVVWLQIATEAQLVNVFRNMCVMVYDLLDDDDEDVRDLASQSAGRILDTQGGRSIRHELNPIVASQKLLGFMSRKWASDSAFVQITLSRAFGPSDALGITERMRRCLTKDTALFMEEKQNLYIDETREVRAWSQVAMRLSPAAVSKAALAQLCTRVEEGLAALTLELRTTPDGPLGWTTKPELFTLGLQIVYGAEWLLYMVGQGVRIPVRPSGLRRQLVNLFASAVESNANCLWRGELERILARAILHRHTCEYRRVTLTDGILGGGDG
ncbi:hypothetical protein BAUCODRAFT_64529, partial [Baudoinia panamericana UAMH 10762]